VQEWLDGHRQQLCAAPRTRRGRVAEQLSTSATAYATPNPVRRGVSVGTGDFRLGPYIDRAVGVTSGRSAYFSAPVVAT